MLGYSSAGMLKIRMYFITETFFLHYPPPVACLDDLRVSGRRLPLPPALNTTSWGQMTTAWQLAQGCRPREDPCTSSRCAPPLTCTPAWDQPSCRSVTVINHGHGPLIETIALALQCWLVCVNGLLSLCFMHTFTPQLWPGTPAGE